VSTPYVAHFRLSAALSPQRNEEMKYMAHVPYSSAVGSITYAMLCTRSNISPAVSIVSRYMYYPDKSHWQVVKWILRYLKGTSNVCLGFGRGNIGLVGYFAGDLDRRSLVMYSVLVFVQLVGKLFYTLQLHCIQYIAVTEAVKEAL